MRQVPLLTVLTLVVFIHAATAQVGQPIVIGQAFSLRSEVMKEDRPIIISVPAGYRSGNASYPVLYVLDGRNNIFHTASTARFLARNGYMPEMIIVGIGNTNRNRTRDLTPPIDGNDERFPNAGQADRFLAFINDELFLYVENNFRTAPYRILVGHSYGGLCAIHAMVSKPDMFNGFVSMSPTLWWNNEAATKKAKTMFREGSLDNKSLYLTLGNEPGNMRTSFDGFLDVLEKYAPEGFQWDSRILEDETHGSVPLRSTYQGLKSIFAGWQVPQEKFSAADIAGIRAHMKGLARKFGYEIKISENMINNLGYRQLRNGDPEKAIKILKYNIELYPDSANVYDSLGEALEAAGKLISAQANYRKAYERGRKIKDPNLRVYQQHLENVTKKLQNIS